MNHRKKFSRNSIYIFSSFIFLFISTSGCISTNNVKIINDKKIITESNALNYKYSLMVNFKKGGNVDTISARSIENQILFMLKEEGFKTVFLYDIAETQYTEVSAFKEDYLIYCDMEIDFGLFENPYEGTEFNVYKSGGYQTEVNADYYILDIKPLKKIAEAQIEAYNENIIQVNAALIKSGKKGLDKKVWANKSAVEDLRSSLPLYLVNETEASIYHSSIFNKDFPKKNTFVDGIGPCINANVDYFFTNITGMKSYWDRKK